MAFVELYLRDIGELPPWTATASLKDGMADFAVANPVAEGATPHLVYGDLNPDNQIPESIRTALET